MFGVVVAIFLTGILPVLVNKTTESGHFPWLKPHLRQMWTIALVLGISALFQNASVQEFAVRLHARWPEWLGYLIFSITGAIFFSVCWWLTGQLLGSHVRLVFSNSPLLTDSVKKRIAVEFDNSQEYLRGIGFDPPLPIPTIQVTEYFPRWSDGKSGVGIFSNNQSPYGDSIIVSPYSAGQEKQMRGAYFSWAFNRLLDVSKYSISDHPNRIDTAIRLSQYYSGSYSRTFSGYSNWDKALWDARSYCRIGFIDTLLFYVFKNFDEEKDRQKDFDVFFWNRIVVGLSVLDSGAENDLKRIVENQGVKWNGEHSPPISSVVP